MASFIGTLKCADRINCFSLKKKDENPDDEETEKSDSSSSSPKPQSKAKSIAIKKRRLKKQKRQNHHHVRKRSPTPSSHTHTSFSLASSSSDSTNATQFITHFQLPSNLLSIKNVPKFTEFDSVGESDSSFIMLSPQGKLLIKSGECADAMLATHKSEENVLEYWTKQGNFMFVYMSQQALTAKETQVELSKDADTYHVSCCFTCTSKFDRVTGIIFTFRLLNKQNYRRIQRSFSTHI